MKDGSEEFNQYFDSEGNYTRLSVVNDLARIREHLEEIETLLVDVDINASTKNLGNDYSYLQVRVKGMKTSRSKMEKYVSETLEFIQRVL